MKLKNSSYDETQKLKFWWNKKNQIVMKIKLQWISQLTNSNCDSTWILTNLNLWGQKTLKGFFSKSILTPWQPMWCSLGSVFRFSQCLWIYSPDTKNKQKTFSIHLGTRQFHVQGNNLIFLIEVCSILLVILDSIKPVLCLFLGGNVSLIQCCFSLHRSNWIYLILGGSCYRQSLHWLLNAKEDYVRN